MQLPAGEVQFLHEDKHESFPQIDTLISDPKITSLQCLYNTSKKKLDIKLIFCKQKYQSFLKVDFNILGVKFSYKLRLSVLMGMIKHSQSTESEKFAISVQYL